MLELKLCAFACLGLAYFVFMRWFWWFLFSDQSLRWKHTARTQERQDG